MKRIIDISLSAIALVVLSPLFLIISILIICSSRGNFIYTQTRVGKDNTDFTLLKFRTMRIDADKNGLLTIGSGDSRITLMGTFLRKYKIDEFPQLWNILIGDMHIVGPRPEVRKYVDLYSEEQKKILTIRPGLTDYASLEYIDESEILEKSEDPEKTYIEVILPHKIELNLQYLNNQSTKEDLKIIAGTLKKIVSRK